MAAKQRKGKKSKPKPKDTNEEQYSGDKDRPLNKNKKVTQKGGRVRKKASLKQLLLFFVGVSTAVSGILYYYYCRYGSAIFLGQGWKDYKWSPYEWRKFIDENEKKILIIGGPHRSGTTILWKMIKAHPEVVGFGDTFETGVDYSEGVLMQEVYPRFGVGMEFKKNFGNIKASKGDDDEKSDGMGRYALQPGVHWTKESQPFKLLEPTNLSKLLNRFAPYWDSNKKFKKDGMMKAKVWVEKSPQNAVLSTFLEGLYNMPVQEDGTIASNSNKSKETEADTDTETDTETATKFLYMTRHPIANCYALDKFVRESMGGFIDFEILLRNYIQLHKYMKMDEKALESPVMWAHLEDFTENPQNVLKGIFSFLKVSTDDETISNVIDEIGDVHSNPNRKYFKKWCDEGIDKHGHLLEKYATELKALDLGYDMDVCG